MIGYADDTTVYVKAKNPEHLRMELQSLGVDYCDENGLVLQGLRLRMLCFFRFGSDRQKYTSQICFGEGFGILRCGNFYKIQPVFLN